MHQVQTNILKLFSNRESLDLKLREIGRIIDVNHPQTIKYHISQLEERGLIKVDQENKKLTRVNKTISDTGSLLSLPILGSANCGEANIYAEDRVEGFLKISKNILKFINNDLFVLKAVGNSMNRAVVDGKNIEDSDFILIDGNKKSPKNNDYIVSIIDGCANIKKFLRDEENNQIVLLSESTQDHSPIYIHESDSYHVAGEVVQVVKNPKNILTKQ